MHIMTGPSRHRRIAAVQGSTGFETQRLLGSFAQKCRQKGLRVAGVIEISFCGSQSGCKSLSVQELTSGEIFPITQKLGAASEACNLDPNGLALACAAVERSVQKGAEVVVLSKFGKLEAARSGLCDAFRAAILADIPVITAVPSIMRQDWDRFAGDLSELIDADDEAVSAWWRSVSRYDDEFPDHSVGNGPPHSPARFYHHS